MLDKLVGRKVIVELANGNVRVSGKLTAKDEVYRVNKVKFTEDEVISVKERTIELLSYHVVKPCDVAGEPAILVNEYADFDGYISKDGRRFVSNDKNVVANLQPWRCVCYREYLLGVVIVEIIRRSYIRHRTLAQT